MEQLLYQSYLATIVILVLVIIILNSMFSSTLPKKWINILTLSFISLTIGIALLMASEMIAPFNTEFYLNPILFLGYVSMEASTLFMIYLLVLKMNYEYNRLLKLLGWVMFISTICLIFVSGLLLLTFNLSFYPLTFYISYELTYGIGCSGFIIMAVKSFADYSSDRLEPLSRFGFFAIALFSLFIASVLGWVAYSVFFLDFSFAMPLEITIFLLMWLSGVSIEFLLVLFFENKYLYGF